jgi:hypothetical protein
LKTIFARTILLLLIFLYSCDRLDDSYDIKVTGVVVDEITKEPVAGASVYLGYTFCDIGDNIVSTGKSTKSDMNGKFKIVYSSDIIDNHGCLYIYAYKDGYIGSTYYPAVIGGELAGALELFHTSKLHLIVKNDTIIDQFDEAMICLYCEDRLDKYPGIVGSRGFYGSATVTEICKGRNFNSTFVFDKMWGNSEYIITVYDNLQIPPKYRTSFRITLAPDSTNYLEVTF